MVAALAALVIAALPVTQDTLPVFVTPPDRGIDEFSYVWGAGGASPLALGVFKRPRTAADAVHPAVPAKLFVRFTHGNLDRSRLLISSGGTRIYAFPAAHGQVCFVHTPRGGGPCVASLIHGAYPQVDPRSDVWGLVDDGAVRVDVTVAHRVIHAHLGRNAFFLALPPKTVVPTRIVVSERNGIRHVYDVKRCSFGPHC